MKQSLKFKIYWTVLKFLRSNKYLKFIAVYLVFLFYKTFRSNKYFIFQKKRYLYFHHMYNMTMGGERAIEIPLAISLLQSFKDKAILEVGNVTSHYLKTNHDIVDKYELAPGVINQDIVNLFLKKKYDLIFSISTMEHIGFNDGYGETNNSTKFMKGLKNMKRLLKQNGIIFVTFPVHYNPNLKKLIKQRKMPFSHEYFLKRISLMNEWREIKYNEVWDAGGYDDYYPNANILYVGIFSKS